MNARVRACGGMGAVAVRVSIHGVIQTSLWAREGETRGRDARARREGRRGTGAMTMDGASSVKRMDGRWEFTVVVCLDRVCDRRRGRLWRGISCARTPRDPARASRAAEAVRSRAVPWTASRSRGVWDGGACRRTTSHRREAWSPPALDARDRARRRFPPGRRARRRFEGTSRRPRRA